MKLIKRKYDNAVVLFLEDDAIVSFEETPTVIGGSHYADIAEETHELIENCGSPEDSLNDADGNPLAFWGNKFIYTNAWALNPEWVEPEVLVEEPVAEPVA